MILHLLFLTSTNHLNFLQTHQIPLWGGVLSQECDLTGLDRPITFFSRRLSDTECNYSTLDKEAFALIYGLKYNRPFIHGRDLDLVSDSEPLVYLLRQTNPSARNARWLAILSEFNIRNIKHLPGVRNIVPDILSRLKDNNIETQIVDSLPWPDVNIVTRSAGKTQRGAANHTPPPAVTSDVQTTSSSSQRLQRSDGRFPEMADNDVTNDVIDLQLKQKSYKPYSDMISYLLSKSCSVPKGLGMDIN